MLSCICFITLIVICSISLAHSFSLNRHRPSVYGYTVTQSKRLQPLNQHILEWRKLNRIIGHQFNDPKSYLCMRFQSILHNKSILIKRIKALTSSLIVALLLLPMRSIASSSVGQVSGSTYSYSSSSSRGSNSGSSRSYQSSNHDHQSSPSTNIYQRNQRRMYTYQNNGDNAARFVTVDLSNNRILSTLILTIFAMLIMSYPMESKSNSFLKTLLSMRPGGAECNSFYHPTVILCLNNYEKRQFLSSLEQSSTRFSIIDKTEDIVLTVLSMKNNIVAGKIANRQSRIGTNTVASVFDSEYMKSMMKFNDISTEEGEEDSVSYVVVSILLMSTGPRMPKKALNVDSSSTALPSNDQIVTFLSELPIYLRHVDRLRLQQMRNDGESKLGFDVKVLWTPSKIDESIRSADELRTTYPDFIFY